MCGLEVEKKHFDALILELDPVNYQKIYFLNFKQLFEVFSLDYVRTIMEDIVIALRKATVKFMDLLNKFASNTGQFLVEICELNNALFSIGCKVKNKQVAFLISHYGLRKNLNDEIDYQDLRESMYQDAAKFNLDDQEGDLKYYLYEENKYYD